MIQWIDLVHGYTEVCMEGKYLCAIVVVALVCITGMVTYALSQGIDGAVLGTALSIFGIIIGAVSKTIYDAKKS